MDKLRVFVASPGDVEEERNIASLVIEELRRTVGSVLNVELETVRWETHARPDIGRDAQDVINRQIGDYDVLVGIMWRRFGTSTKRAGSGTAEEFERAYTAFKRFQRPKIMFYFRRKPFDTTDRKELLQFAKVIAFRHKLQQDGVMFWEYAEPLDFERSLREHLTMQLAHATRGVASPRLETSPVTFLSYKREDIRRVDSVYYALKTEVFSPWMDIHDILPGKNWVMEITRAIDTADFFLTFVSRNSVGPGAKSKTSFSVESEVAIAQRTVESRRVDEFPPSPSSYLIPVRLNRVQLPDELAVYQWIDMFRSSEVDRLVAALKAIWTKRTQIGSS